MNHDIMHCKNKECKDRQSCVRYLAHLDLKKNNIEGVYSYYIPTTAHETPQQKGDCLFFLHKKYLKEN